jgi:UDP-4-amino-4,6-dideoxy-N-acetyl-beta-L-altrosamine transaminase
MNDPLLPYARHTIEEDDVAAVAAALRSDFLTTGPLVEQFERAFAAAVGASHAVACNSGTAALHLAALALDLAEGQAAVVPAVTFLATANAVRMSGAEVVLADVDKDSGLLTAETLEAARARGEANGWRVRTAFPVHLNGQVSDMNALASASERFDLHLVEDACHALGVERVGAGGRSAAACFSTHAVKTVATGEGGVVTTRDEKSAERMRRLRSHGMNRDAATFADRKQGFEGNTPNPWYYEMAEIGWNYRMPDVLCALGLSQLKKLDRSARRRREIAARYEQLLRPLAPAVRPVSAPTDSHGWHLYAILVDFPALGMTRAHFMNALRAQGIGSQVHYIPLHRQPYYRRRYGEIVLPGAEAYYARCLSIPMFPAMTDADVERVAAAVTRLVGGAAA